MALLWANAKIIVYYNYSSCRKAFGLPSDAIKVGLPHDPPQLHYLIVYYFNYLFHGRRLCSIAMRLVSCCKPVSRPVMCSAAACWWWCVFVPSHAYYTAMDPSVPWFVLITLTWNEIKRLWETSGQLHRSATHIRTAQIFSVLETRVSYSNDVMALEIFNVSVRLLPARSAR